MEASTCESLLLLLSIALLFRAHYLLWVEQPQPTVCAFTSLMRVTALGLNAPSAHGPPSPAELRDHPHLLRFDRGGRELCSPSSGCDYVGIVVVMPKAGTRSRASRRRPFCDGAYEAISQRLAPLAP